MSNSRKIFVLCMFIFLVQSNCANDWGKDTRDFWSAYFGVIKGREFHLNEDCLSGKFNDLFDDLNRAILTMDVVQVIYNIEKMIELEKTTCPLGDSTTILKDFNTAMRNGTLLKNVLKNSSLLKDKLTKYFDSDKSPCALGTCIGELTKILTYGTSFSSWKDEHDDHSNYSDKNFLN